MRTIINALILVACAATSLTAQIIYLGTSGGNVYEVTPAATVSLLYSMPQSGNQGSVAVDSSGALYAADFRTLGGNIYQISQGVASSYANLNSVSKLAFANGSLYAKSDYSTLTVITKLTTGQAAQEVFSSTASGLTMAVDSSGSVYIANTQSDTISKVVSGSLVDAFTNTGLTFATALTFDLENNLYLKTLGDGLIHKVTPGGAVSLWQGALFGYDNGVDIRSMSVGSDGSIYSATLGGRVFITTDGVTTFIDTGISNTISLAVGAIPEPATYAIGLSFAALTFALWRRRRICSQ